MDNEQELAAVEWLLARGAKTSNPFLAGLYEQIKDWHLSQDEEPDHPDPLSHKQLQELVRTHQGWLTRQKIRDAVRDKFRGS